MIKDCSQNKLIIKLHYGENLNNLSIVDITNDEIDTVYKQIGQKVRNLRKERGVSQLDLALAIGYKSVSSIAKAELLIENKHFNIEQIYKISKAFNIQMKYFFE